MAKPMTGKEKKVGFIFSVELHTEFKREAARREISMKQATAEAVQDWLDAGAPSVQTIKPKKGLRKGELIRDRIHPPSGKHNDTSKTHTTVAPANSGAYSGSSVGGLPDALIEKYDQKLREFQEIGEEIKRFRDERKEGGA